MAWRRIQEWRERTEKERGQYVQQEERERAREEEERGWRVQRKRGHRGRVAVEGRRADWEAVARVHHARWVEGEGKGERDGGNTTSESTEDRRDGWRTTLRG